MTTIMIKIAMQKQGKNQLMHLSCFAVPHWASSCSLWLIFLFQISTHRRVQKRQTTYDRFPAIWNSLLVLCRALLLCYAMLYYAAICARPTDVRQLLDNCELPTAQIYHLPFHSCVPAHIQGVFLLHFNKNISWMTTHVSVHRFLQGSSNSYKAQSSRLFKVEILRQCFMKCARVLC